MNVVLKLSGKKIKAAVEDRRVQLRDELAQWREAFKAYTPEDDIRLAGNILERIEGLEREYARVGGIADQLEDETVYELTLQDLMHYGLDTTAGDA